MSFLSKKEKLTLPETRSEFLKMCSELLNNEKIHAVFKVSVPGGDLTKAWLIYKNKNIFQIDKFLIHGTDYYVWYKGCADYVHPGNKDFKIVDELFGQIQKKYFEQQERLFVEQQNHQTIFSRIMQRIRS